MKTLELNQMELIEGGQTLSCAGAAIGAVGLVLGIASGPVGWLALAGLYVGAVSVGAGAADCAIGLAENGRPGPLDSSN